MSMISVVVCTHNRANILKRMLESFAGQYGLNNEAWELLVVDNGSTDATRTIIEDMQEKLALRYIHEPCLGLSHARNRGVAEAKGDIVAFLDDDVLVAPDWLQNMRLAFEQTGADAVGGRSYCVFFRKPPAWMGPALREHLVEVNKGRQRKLLPDGWGVFGLNLAFRKESILKYGGFTSHLGRKGKSLLAGEECALLQSISHAGGQVWYDPGPVVGHIVTPERLSYDYVRRWRYGMGRTEGLQEIEVSLRMRLLRVLLRSANVIRYIFILMWISIRGDKDYQRRMMATKLWWMIGVLVERWRALFRFSLKN